MSILEFKQNYNKLLEREKKAELFLENPKVTQADKDKWMPKFVEITEQLSKFMREYKQLTGQEMQDNEVLNGFKVA